MASKKRTFNFQKNIIKIPAQPIYAASEEKEDYNSDMVTPPKKKTVVCPLLGDSIPSSASSSASACTNTIQSSYDGSRAGVPEFRVGYWIVHRDMRGVIVNITQRGNIDIQFRSGATQILAREGLQEATCFAPTAENHRRDHVRSEQVRLGLGPNSGIYLSASNAALKIFSSPMRFLRQGHASRWIVDFNNAARGNLFLVEAEETLSRMVSYVDRVMSALGEAPRLSHSYTGVLVVVAQSATWALVATRGSDIEPSCPHVYFVDHTTTGRGETLLSKAMSKYDERNPVNDRSAIVVAPPPGVSLPLYFALYKGAILNPLFLNAFENKMIVAIGKGEGANRSLCRVLGHELSHCKLRVRRKNVPIVSRRDSDSDGDDEHSLRGDKSYKPPPYVPYPGRAREGKASERLSGTSTEKQLPLLPAEILAMGLLVNETTSKTSRGRPGRWSAAARRDVNLEDAAKGLFFQAGPVKMRPPIRAEAVKFCRAQAGKTTLSMADWTNLVTATGATNMTPLGLGPGAEDAMRQLTSFQVRVDASLDTESHVPVGTKVRIDVDQYIRIVKDVSPWEEPDEEPNDADGYGKSACFVEFEAKLRVGVAEIERKGFGQRNITLKSATGRLKSKMLGSQVRPDAVAAVRRALRVLTDTSHRDQLWYVNSSLCDVLYYRGDKKGKFECFSEELKGLNKWVSLGLGRSEGGEPLDVLIVAPGDVEGCRRAVIDVMAAAYFVIDSPSDAAKLAASRIEFGQSLQAVHGSQQLIKMAALYLIAERQKKAGTFNAKEFTIALRIFNNKMRGQDSNVEIPDGDVRNFSTDTEDGEQLLHDACRAAGTALYDRALSRSIIPTLELEFPAKVKLLSSPRDTLTDNVGILLYYH